MNSTMRLLREHLNLSIQEVADTTGLSFRTILRAEQGASLNPDRGGGSASFMAKHQRSWAWSHEAETEPITNNCKSRRKNTSVNE